MSSPTHHTPPSPAPQPTFLSLDPWESEIVPALPDALALQASHLHAIHRHRAISRASDLLRGLLAYVLCVSSFRQLGLWAVLTEVADISDTAWRKRLQTASPWLLWLGAELLAPSSPPPVLPTARRRVLLVDATCFPQATRQGQHWRLHTAYDFLAGRLAQVRITDPHTAEALSLYDLGSGDLVVADNAYGYRRSVAEAVLQHADVVLRITAAPFPVETAEGIPVDVAAWLRRQGPALRSREVRCHWHGQVYAVRLLALKLSEEARRAAIRHKRRKARDDGRKVTAETLELAGWVLLVTTLSGEVWWDEDVARLYRVRWQVEVFFKRFKQAVAVHRLRARTAALAEATVRAVLVAWLLQEGEAAFVRERLGAVAREKAAESWAEGGAVRSGAVAQLCVATLRQQVQGQWKWARVWECLARLERYLVASPRRRQHLESEMRRWLETHEGIAAFSPGMGRKAA
jgi:hypothetical protein